MSSNKVLLSGFFDLFHMGHLLALKEAKAAGDFLVVHVASDKEAMAVKGDLRPVIPGIERAAIVENISCVDEVIYSNEFLSFEELLDLVKPDIVIRNIGGNLEGDEEGLCQQRGIKIVRIPRCVPESGLDTTGIIQKILFHGSETRRLAGINYVLCKGDKILLQKRDAKPGILSPGMFCFPGGGIEEWEDAFTAMFREVREETGITLIPKECKFLMDITYPWGDRNRVFVCQTDCEPQSNEGVMSWHSLEEIEQMELAANQSEIVSALKSI